MSDTPQPDYAGELIRLGCLLMLSPFMLLLLLFAYSAFRALVTLVF